MARSLVPQQLGFDYQAWLFWERAAKLLVPGSRVAEVKFEAPGLGGFDDVVVRFTPPMERGGAPAFEFEQVQAKYHIHSGGAFRISSFTDPHFIGNEKSTLLGNLAKAYRASRGVDFDKRQFLIISPWSIHPDDKQFAKLWRDNTIGFRLEVLRSGGSRSEWGKLRAAWRAAADLATDDELCEMLAQLRIAPGHNDINGRFIETVNASLVSAGLKPIVPNQSKEPYSQIPWNQHKLERTSYTKCDIEAIATECDLWGGARQGMPSRRRLGIRTRLEWGEQMEVETDHLLALENRFEGRVLGEGATWEEIGKSVKVFLQGRECRTGECTLDMRAPISVAFAAGYMVPTKDGRPVFPLQRRRGGVDEWTAITPDPAHGAWNVVNTEDMSGRGDSVAVGLSVSQDVWADMRSFVVARLPEVGHVVNLAPATGVGQRGIVSAGHATYLVDELSRVVQGLHQGGKRDLVHLFAAMPNGLAFFLGQEGERLGRCQLYEFDFPRMNGGSYTPSLLVPDHLR